MINNDSGYKFNPGTMMTPGTSMGLWLHALDINIITGWNVDDWNRWSSWSAHGNDDGWSSQSQWHSEPKKYLACELCVFWQNARCAQTCRFSTFLRRGLSFSLALLTFATRLYSFSISGCLSQVIKSTNANNRKIASGTLDTSQKFACLLKTATCRSIHLRCGRISIFQIAIKLFKKFWVICRSTSCVRSVIQLIITVTSVPVNVFFVVVIVIIFILNNLWIRVMP